MRISTIVKGAQIGVPGYGHIASTPEQAYIFSKMEEYGQERFSEKIASLYAVKQKGTHELTVAHVQGRHVGSPGRFYDTRIYHRIAAHELRGCDNKLGAVACSLPRMQTFETTMQGQLPDSFSVAEPTGVDDAVAQRLCNRIMQAIVECKYLLVKLDTTAAWRENGVLENTIAKTFFSALDRLPKILRPCASFALSVDAQCPKDLLTRFLIILHHGENSFGLHNTIEIAWSDLTKAKSDVDFMCQSELYTNLAKIIVDESHGKDLFDSDLSSVELVLRLKEIKEEKKAAGSLDYFTWTKEWEKALTCNDLTSMLTSKIESRKYDLTDIYVLFEGNLHDEIIGRYVDLYVQHVARMSYDAAVVALCDARDRKSIEPTLKERLVDRLTLHLIECCTLTADQRIDLEKHIGSNYKEAYEKQLIAQPIDLWTAIFQKGAVANRFKDIFARTSYYKKNAAELCHEPFLSQLDPAKKRELRMLYFDKKESFAALYAGMSYNEIAELNISDKQKMALLERSSDKARFIKEHAALCEKEFNKAFLSAEDISATEIYRLYSDAKTHYPKVDDSNVTRANLRIALNNAAKINPAVDMTDCIRELYNLSNTIAEIYEIYQIANVSPADELLCKIAVRTTDDLKLFLQMRAADAAQPTIDFARLIANADDVVALLKALKKNNISYDACRHLVEKRLDKDQASERKKKRILSKYFAANESNATNEGEQNEQDKRYIIRKIALFFKANATRCYIVLALVVGFVVGFFVGDYCGACRPNEVPVPPETPIVEQPDTCSTITLYFSPLDTASNERIDSLCSIAFAQDDTLQLFAFVDAGAIWLDSIKTTSAALYDKEICDSISRREFKDFVNNQVFNTKNSSYATIAEK